MANNIRKLFVGWGVIQCILILFAYLFLFYYKNDVILISLFVYTLFLGFFMIRNNDGKILANSTALMFLLFIFLYGIFNSIIYYSLEEYIPDEIYTATVLYAVSIPALLLGIVGKNKKNVENYPDIYDKNILNDRQSSISNVIKVFILAIFILYKTIFFYQAGVLFTFNSSGVESRLAMFENVSQLDVVIGLLIIGLFSYFIYYYKNLSKKMIFIISGLLFYYILLQLGAGNRRDFVPIIIAIFWVFINIKRFRFTIFGFIGILFVVFGFNYLGTLRADDGGRGSSDKIMMTLTSNEFVYPFFTLEFEVEEYQKLRDNYSLYWGTTYIINPILTYIPRAIFPEKPNSLANDFLDRKFGRHKTIGFAYSPVTESFVNFSVFGPLIVFFIIGRIIRRLQGSKNQIFNFIVFITVIDFCRGEFSTYIYQLSFIGLFLVLHSIKKKKV